MCLDRDLLYDKGPSHLHIFRLQLVSAPVLGADIRTPAAPIFTLASPIIAAAALPTNAQDFRSRETQASLVENPCWPRSMLRVHGRCATATRERVLSPHFIPCTVVPKCMLEQLDWQ